MNRFEYKEKPAIKFAGFIYFYIANPTSEKIISLISTNRTFAKMPVKVDSLCGFYESLSCVVNKRNSK